MSRFERTELLVGEAAQDYIKSRRAAVFGVGGVGGMALEALARAGVGELDIFDNDTISQSNINRQILALSSTVGQSKAQAARTRALDINPDARVTARELFFLPENADEVDFSAYNYVIDAIDTVSAKLEIISRCQASGVPVISCMGTGNKLDPSRLKISDISQTSVCPLARVMRHELKKRGIERLAVVFSDEPPIKPKHDSSDGHRQTPGSCSFVPPAAGLLLASRVINDFLEEFNKADK